MARGYSTRRLQVFSVHGRTDDGAIEYETFFRSLASLAARERTLTVGESTLALPVLVVEDRHVRFRAYEGDRTQYPLIFDTLNAGERIEQLDSGEVVATKTHGAIDLDTRECIVEYTHRGAKTDAIARLIDELGRNVLGIDTLEFSLVPVADESFIEALDRFSQVRVARMRLVRPNHDWTPEYETITEIARESDARTIEVEITAKREGTVRRDGGFFRTLREMARGTHPNVKSASVSGVRPGEDAVATVSLAHHIESVVVSVHLTQFGHVDDVLIEESIANYLKSRRWRP